MPVQKFRSIEDMPPVSPPNAAGDETWDRVARLWRRASLMDPSPKPRGTFKYRNIEEARQARDELAAEAVRGTRREPPAKP